MNLLAKSAINNRASKAANGSSTSASSSPQTSSANATPTNNGSSASNSAGNKFVGYLVSVESKNVFYQGVVNAILPDRGVIQLKNCFQNGVHCGVRLIDISTTNIDNIEILADPVTAASYILKTGGSLTNGNGSLNGSGMNGSSNCDKLASSATNSTSQVTNGKNGEERHSVSSTSSNMSSNGISQSVKTNPTKPDIKKKPGAGTMPAAQRINARRDECELEENCFEASQDDLLNGEFDFEKNLALFDKNEFYEQVGNSSSNGVDVNFKKINLAVDTDGGKTKTKLSPIDQILKSIQNSNLNRAEEADSETLTVKAPQAQEKYYSISVATLFSSVTTTNGNETETKTNGKANSAEENGVKTNGIRNYRYDEMVIPSGEPINFTQIQIPESKMLKKQSAKNYVTDEGFVVPCIEYDLREKLLAQALNLGFSPSRLIESMGRSVAEMAIQLVGGPIRFLPKNAHQPPSLLILANGLSIQGAYAISAARLLLLRQCKVYLFVTNTNENTENELTLFESCDGACVFRDVNNINKIKSIDLIINGLESPKSLNGLNARVCKSLNDYVETCKASVLTIDPSSEGPVFLCKSKWCMVPVLPMCMSANCGRVYLCDLGLTSRVFDSLGIKYKSPFGAKFVIPLHDQVK